MDLQPRPLTLDSSKLEGLSQRLIASHHQNNYLGAVKRLNAIRQQLGALDWSAASSFVVNGLKREELIAANSTVLHELYFDSIGGNGVLPSCGLSVGLERDFGSVDRWRAEFTALARALGGGSGWVLLSWSARESRLVNHWASDHTQLLGGGTPVLALDMYEHAYHLDYGAFAGAYVDAFMRNIHWDGVYRRYGAAVAGDAEPFGVESPAPGDGIVIDVRRAGDHDTSPDEIAGAVWRDPARVGEWSQEFAPGRAVFVYCLKGMDIGRSTALALRARGIEAHFLVGGIEAWRAAGRPVQPNPALQPGLPCRDHF